MLQRQFSPPASTSTLMTDIAIIGAGPHALTLVTHLLQKRKDMARRFLVFDPSGTWMQKWHHQFATLAIPHLRSPAVHHPDPHAGALRNFASYRHRELFPPYDRPGTRLFDDFCQDVVQRWQLQDRVYQARVEHLYLEPQSQSRPFHLILDNGQSVWTRRVVLATGSGPAHLPDWVKTIPTPYPSDCLCHASDLDLRQMTLAGETILIVGSGLTSGHLAIGAVEQGARVILMARRHYYDKIFDAEPGWLGPKYLKGFQAEPSWQQRSHMIQTARNGGSLTPELMLQLRRLERQGQVTCYEQCQVQQAHWLGQQWQVRCHLQTQHTCIDHLPIQRIWLATGTRLALPDHPLLQDIQATFPTTWIQGLPVLDEHLRWPGCELFLMGSGAGLQIGPVARNLAGARMARDRIVPALTKPTLALTVAPSA